MDSGKTPQLCARKLFQQKRYKYAQQMYSTMLMQVAMADCQDADLQQRMCAVAYCNQSACSLHLNDKETAITELQNAILADPDWPRPYFRLSRIFLLKGKYYEALAYATFGNSLRKKSHRTTCSHVFSSLIAVMGISYSPIVHKSRANIDPRYPTCPMSGDILFRPTTHLSGVSVSKLSLCLGSFFLKEGSFISCPFADVSEPSTDVVLSRVVEKLYPEQTHVQELGADVLTRVLAFAKTRRKARLTDIIHQLDDDTSNLCVSAPCAFSFIARAKFLVACMRTDEAMAIIESGLRSFPESGLLYLLQLECKLLQDDTGAIASWRMAAKYHCWPSKPLMRISKVWMLIVRSKFKSDFNSNTSIEAMQDFVSSYFSDLVGCSKTVSCTATAECSQTITEKDASFAETCDGQKQSQVVDGVMESIQPNPESTLNNEPFHTAHGEPGPTETSMLDIADVECQLCLNLLYKPVTTPCGHCFCYTCVTRCLEHTPRCPMCRSSLKYFLMHRQFNLTITLEKQLKKLLPSEYAQRVQHVMQELQEQDEPLPIFVCMLSLPGWQCPLHIFEHRYRLMIQRCLESGERRFGMCAHTSNGPAQYGVVLGIDSCEFTPDGRSILMTTASRRFRIQDTTIRDEYIVAKVQYVEDEPIDPAERIDGQSYSELVQHARVVIQALWSRLPIHTRAIVVLKFGEIPQNDDLLSFWIAGAFRMSEAIQYNLLRSTSKFDRLSSVIHDLLSSQSSCCIM